jgi:hypothetical protein
VPRIGVKGRDRRSNMKRYSIKNQTDSAEFIEILKEIEDGFIIRHTRLKNGYEKSNEETISRHLFNICLKTGYLTEPVLEAALA